jgi:hypothetical protein
MQCDADSSLIELAVPSSCRASADHTPAPSISHKDLLGLIATQFQRDVHWARWTFLICAPLLVPIIAMLVHGWASYILRGFAPRAPGKVTRRVGVSAPPAAAAPATGAVETVERDAEVAVGGREQFLRASIVRTTQSLNALDGELVELETRLARSSRELSHALRKQIPTLGRRMIELIKAIDKEGFAPNEPLIPENVTRMPRKATG